VDFEGQILTGQVPGTGGFDKFEQVELGTVELAAGQHRVEMAPVKLHYAYAFAAIKGITLQPVSPSPV